MLTFTKGEMEEDLTLLQAEAVEKSPTTRIEEPELRGAQAVSTVTAIKPVRGEYRVADLTTVAERINADLFHSPEYTPVLMEVIHHVLQQEAPILDALLVQRVARAHGFQRSGRLIRDRVLELAERHHHLQNAGPDEQFVWHAQGDVETWSSYRVPFSANDARSVEEIAVEELRVAAALVNAGDSALEVARLLGVKRLTGLARERIERVLQERFG